MALCETIVLVGGGVQNTRSGQAFADASPRRHELVTYRPRAAPGGAG